MSTLPHKSFTCYFCNSLIQNQSQENHNTTCASVLEPCPNKCGAYFQRSEREKHLRKCKNNFFRRSSSDILDGDGADFTMINQSNSRMGTFPGNSGQSSNSQKSLAIYNNINERIQSLETLFRQLSTNLATMKQYTSASHRECGDKLHSLNGRIQMQLQLTQQQVQHTEKQLNDIMYNQTQTTQVSKLALDTQNRMAQFETSQHRLQQEQSEFLAEQISVRRDLAKLREFHEKENASIAALWIDQKEEQEKLKNGMEATKRNLDELQAKYAAINFDLRATTRIATDNADRMELQEKDMRQMKETVAQLQLDLRSIESLQSGLADLAIGPPGRLLWRITDFASKMESAKEHNTILKSPIFYSNLYGYKLRLILYLNGIKKWKGRHLIACFHVLKNEYDDLLQWPCYIEGNVTLKDINTKEGKHHVKYICAKREYGDEDGEEPQESSTQYIFIPHSTLLKSCFVKENTIYLEVNILKSSRDRQETVI